MVTKEKVQVSHNGDYATTSEYNYNIIPDKLKSHAENLRLFACWQPDADVFILISTSRTRCAKFASILSRRAGSPQFYVVRFDCVCK